MLDYTYLRSNLNNYEEKIASLETALHLEDLKNRQEELTQISQEENFWQDNDRAIKIQSEISSIDKKIEAFAKLEEVYSDLFVLIDLAQEESDEDSDAELEDSVEDFYIQYNKLYLETLFTGEYDSNNAYLSLQAGAGGTEAMDWVEMLLRMYQRYAEHSGFEFKILNQLDGEEAGIKNVDFTISGEFAYGNLRSEMGVHRLVRISPFDSSGRRHTSFASLEVVPEINDDVKIDIQDEDLRIDTYRASGAGGQHVNKTSSAVRITHIPTGIVTASQAERSQLKNKETAMSQLKSRLLALAERLNKEKIEDLKGEQMEIAWGSQIRSYVFQPYTMVKDHRTNFEDTAVEAVMDGDIQDFINAYLAEDE